MQGVDLRVFEAFPVLQTKRLLMRQVDLRDARAIFAMRANARLNTFIARPNMQQVEDAEALVSKTRKQFELKQGIAWAGSLRDGKQIIGTCGFNRIEHENLRAEIGGELSPLYWGKGIAAEAFFSIVAFGFEDLGLESIEARIFPENRGAKHLLDEAGFVQEALFERRVYFRGRFQDVAVYTLFKGAERW